MPKEEYNDPRIALIRKKYSPSGLNTDEQDRLDRLSWQQRGEGKHLEITKNGKRLNLTDSTAKPALETEQKNWRLEFTAPDYIAGMEEDKRFSRLKNFFEDTKEKLLPQLAKAHIEVIVEQANSLRLIVRGSDSAINELKASMKQQDIAATVSSADIIVKNAGESRGRG